MNIIEIEHLSKKYLINHEHQTCDSLKETFSKGLKSFIKRFAHPSQWKQEKIFEKEEFWALKDVSLEIKEGDRIALMGRNGSGKSTLLKILSRITEPTEGKIKIWGRISSLLEVGTGFHPDLTGRENILLNGVIMGMSYREIRKKFDEIVAFSEIEKFLDTPLKRYSSGMFMRLGFAIAAHLDSKIMILDEVLAVGDAQFQQKCLKKMQEIGAQNRTIIFVSHNIQSVLSLCNKGALLNMGRLIAFEPIEKCVNHSLGNCRLAGLQWQGNLGDEHIKITRTSLQPPIADSGVFAQGDKTVLEIDFEVFQPHNDLFIGFSILNSHNITIARSDLSNHSEYYSALKKPGKYQASFPIDLDLFHPGEYQVKLEAAFNNQKNRLEEEILLNFALLFPNHSSEFPRGNHQNGISLGNRWKLS